MITRTQTLSYSKGLTEGFPDLAYILRATVGHNVSRDSMEAKNIVHQKISSFQGYGEFGRATKCTAFDNLSTVVSMVVLPCESGSPIMKSRAM